MADIATERGKLRVALGDGETALRRRLCTAFSVSHDDDRRRADRGVLRRRRRATRRGCAPPRRRSPTGSDSDRRRGAILARWCEEPAARAAMLDEYLDCFLTDKGETRQTLITKEAAAKAAGDPVAVLQAEAARALRFFERARRSRARRGDAGAGADRRRGAGRL